MNKVTGLWINTSVVGFQKFCSLNNIGYQEWTDVNYNYEVRIDIFDLNQEQIDELKEYLDRNDIDEYTYITIWN